MPKYVRDLIRLKGASELLLQDPEIIFEARISSPILWREPRFHFNEFVNNFQDGSVGEVQCKEAIL